MPQYSMAEAVKMRQRGRELLKSLADKHKTPVRDIVGKYRDAALVSIRVEFINAAMAMGMGSVVASRMIRRHHTTALYHRNGWRARKYAMAKAREARYGGT